jgi:23S rRNA (adenine1618-N6)-methyltransferase
MELKNFVKENKYENLSIDFSNNEAVLALNTALLKYFYDIDWKIPKNYLCPPIPGRVDYMHYIADILSRSNDNQLPNKVQVKALDIGTGANCIYPIVGNRAYGWDFVASDIDKTSLECAADIINANECLHNHIIIKKQDNKDYIFKNIIEAEDKFDFTMCNPPFHKSKKDAKNASTRKVRNLSSKKNNKVKLNFGGQHNELWCEGGELEFIIKMIIESVVFQKNCLWFTSLVSKNENLRILYKILKENKILEYKTVEMIQGNKTTRFIAWTFFDKKEQKNWFLNK